MAKDKVDSNSPATAKEVMEQHIFSSGLYSQALIKSKGVEDIIKSVYVLPSDGTGGNARMSQIVRGGAVLEKFRQMLGGNVSFSVMPLAAGDGEKKITSRLEKAIVGIHRRIKYETKRDYDRDAKWWYIFRGQAMYQVKFKPEYKNTDKFPIRVYTPDPNTVFPVMGNDGLLWYTKESTVYGRELEVILKSGKEDSGWLTKEEGYKDDEYRLVEYWDDKAHALVCCGKGDDSEDHLIYAKNHKYGFVNLSIGYCMDTPMASAEWAYSSVIAPIMDSLKQVYILMEKVAVGVNLFYYPIVLYISADGRPMMWNPQTNTGADFVPMMAGTDLKVLNPTPNAPLINQLVSFHLGDISLMGLPDIAFGQSASNQESGFARAQVLDVISGAVKDKLPQLEQAAGDNCGNILRLIDQFAPGSGFDWSIPVNMED